MPGYVYIVRAEMTSLYKIGSTAKPIRRMEQLTRKMGLKLELVYLIRQSGRRVAYELETSLHHYFAEKYVESEWFDLDDEDFDKLGKLDLTPPFLFDNTPEKQRSKRAFPSVPRIRPELCGPLKLAHYGTTNNKE